MLKADIDSDNLTAFLQGDHGDIAASVSLLHHKGIAGYSKRKFDDVVDLSPDGNNPFRDLQRSVATIGSSSRGLASIASLSDSSSINRPGVQETISNGKLYHSITVDRQPSNEQNTTIHDGDHKIPKPRHYRPYYYSDFETIDWLKDVALDRHRHREILKAVRKSACGYFRRAFDNGSGWFCVALVGICTGLVAGVIDIGATWMSDLKEGICSDAFWFNREQCCWSANDSSFDEQACGQWYTWAELIGDNRQDFGAFVFKYLLYILWSLVFAMSSAFMVLVFAPYACVSGIPEIKTILSGFIIRGYLGKWTLLIKSVGLMLAVSAGLSLGKEGPLVHVATCVGNVISYCFPKYGRNEAKKREILSAAAAAGVAVAFGAPIGGVLFSLEEASYYFPLKTLWRSFFCALVSATTLRVLNPFGNDHLVQFYVEYHTQWHALEILPFILLGVVGGVFGALFVKANIWVCSKRKYGRLGHYPMFEVFFITFVTALIAFPNEFTRMNTSNLIKVLFSKCGPEDVSDLCDYRRNSTKLDSVAEAGGRLYGAVAKLFIAFIFKAVITVFTFGIRVPSGLFIPSLAVGAIAGRIMGLLLEQVALKHLTSWPFKTFCKVGQPCINPGLYAMIGAAAALGGVTRMTLSLVAIMIELTGGLNYIVPLMIATMTAKWVGDRITDGGIYDMHIRLNNYPYLDNKEEFRHTTIAADVMQPRHDEIPLQVVTQDSMTVEDIENVLDKSNFCGFPVVISYESQYLVGYVRKRDILGALKQCRLTEIGVVGESKVYFTDCTPEPEGSGTPPPVKLRNIVDLSPITVTDQTPMETVLEMFRKMGLRQILVTHNGRILGVITKKDVLNHIERVRSMDSDMC